MLDRKELKEIAQMHDDSPCFVTLYLNVNPLSNPRGEHIIEFNNMLKNTIESLDKKVYKLVKDDLEKINSYVLGNKRLFKKGLAILSSTHKTFWKEYHLSVPVKSELIVGKTPFIKPLLDVTDQSQRYVVLLVDKESARIFLMHLGEIEEHREVHTPDVPGKHKKGGWFALSQNHYDRHIDFHVTLHLNDVVKKLDSFMAGEEISGLLIGGADEAVSRTKEILPQTVIGKNAGTFQAEMFATSDEVLTKAETVINAFEKKKRDETVDKLINQTLKNENAVLGLENVMNALQERKVMRLIYVRDFNPNAYACTKCGSVSVQALKECPYCKGGMDKADYIIDIASQKAVEQGAIVEVVAENRKLSDSGGIGAFLRF